MMKKITLLVCLALSLNLSAQTIVNFDANATFVGYMSVGNPLGGFEGGWGVPDLIVEVDTGANTATLKPNRINDLAEPYWFNDSANDLLGNGTMNASFFVEDQSGTLAATNFNFVGNISSYTLDSQWTVSAFIKVFSAGFSSLLVETYVPITSSGDFSVSYDGTSGGLIVQYGFLTIGPNVNPQASFDTQYDALGGVVVTSKVLSVNDKNLVKFNSFPNPTKDSWNIKTNNERISTIQVYDMLGKSVLSLTPNNTEAKIDATTLKSGLYFAKISTDNGSSSLKLIKN